MNIYRTLCSLLLVLCLMLGMSVSVMAVGYSGDVVAPGLSDIKPGDTLTLPENTDWATLTAVWGVVVRFYDSEAFGGELIDDKADVEGGSVSAVSAPIHDGYAFTGWTRIDENPNDARLVGDVVNIGYGAGSIDYQANYKRVLADGQVSGTVTVINTTHDYEYAGYKILDAEINARNVDAIIYTIREDSPWFEFVKKYFDLTEMRTETLEGEEEVIVYKADPKVGFDPKTAFENLPTDGVTPDLEMKKPTRDGVIMWDPVPFGYYAITSALGAWVTVHTNNPNATVIDKNQGPKIEKYIIEDGGRVKTNDASFGESVKFDIEVKASNYKATELITYYHIKDTVSPGFDYDFTDSSNVIVTVTGTQEPISTRTLSAVGSLEELKTVDSGYCFSYDKNDPLHFDITVKWATLNAAGRLMPISSDEWNYIGVTYNATLNNSAVIAGSGNPNTASLAYDLSSGFDPENPPKQQPDPNVNTEDPGLNSSTLTYTYALAIEKVDAADPEEHLAGVQFTTEDFRAAKISDGIYEVIADDDTSTAVECFEVPEEGFILIKGLGAGTYTFQESYTLPGYNLMQSEPFVLTAAYGDDYVSAGAVYETDCALIKVVENSAGVELPSTGGVGTAPFVLSGVLLMLAAGTVCFLVRKKEEAR